MSLVQSFTDVDRGKVAVNLGRVTHAKPCARWDEIAKDFRDRVQVFVEGGPEDGFVLATSYPDFVYAWGRAVTPAPPLIVSAGSRG